MVPDNIVCVDFNLNPNLDNRSKFLNICKTELCEDDYVDLLEAIISPYYYNKCDEVIQDLVNIYYDRYHT